MSEFKIIEVKQSALENNDRDAELLRSELKACHTFLLNLMILSVPEGHDKPLKYPLMFSICDVLLINKIDVMSVFDFDLEKCKEYVWRRNPNMKIISICAKTGEGIQEWSDWLREQTCAWIK